MAQEDRKVGRFEDGTDAVIGALIEVHRHLGPGLLESAYEACVCAELCERGLKFERQRPLAVDYKGVQLDCGYRLCEGSRPITPSPSALPSFLCDPNEPMAHKKPGTASSALWRELRKPSAKGRDEHAARARIARQWGAWR